MISDFHCSKILFRTMTDCDDDVAVSIDHEHSDHNAAQMSERDVKNKERIDFKFDFFF